MSLTIVHDSFLPGQFSALLSFGIPFFNACNRLLSVVSTRVEKGDVVEGYKKPWHVMAMRSIVYRMDEWMTFLGFLDDLAFREWAASRRFDGRLFLLRVLCIASRSALDQCLRPDVWLGRAPGMGEENISKDYDWTVEVHLRVEDSGESGIHRKTPLFVTQLRTCRAVLARNGWVLGPMDWLLARAVLSPETNQHADKKKMKAYAW
eukprot:scaffold6661_cov109-Cylindrotheca_fusiformis.AAC.11